MLTYAESDINKALAARSHRGTSFYPERRAAGYVTGYIQDMAAIVAEFEPFATDDNRAALAADLERYRQGYLKRLHAYLAAHGRCLSPMITGPANFPTRRNEKANNSADKRREEWLDYCRRIPEKLRHTYDPRRLARAPIVAGDPDAPERLQAKITAAEKAQAMMKAANKLIKGKKSQAEKLTALAGLGIGEQSARRLFEPDFCGRIGFADYRLKNNNANIRRMKQRLAEIEQARAQAAATPVADKVINGCTVSENTQLNRLQLFFEGKPSAELRANLKSRGFHWSPSQKAWQRQLTQAARLAAATVLNS
jgi:hypothetical protein